MLSNVSSLSIEEVKSQNSSPTTPIKSETTQKTESAVNVPLQNLQEQKTVMSLDDKVISLQKEKDALTQKRNEVVYKLLVIGFKKREKHLTETMTRKATEVFLKNYEKKNTHHMLVKFIESLDGIFRDKKKEDQVKSLENYCSVLKDDISNFEAILKDS